MGEGALGEYRSPTGPQWLPVRVDSQGRLIVSLITGDIEIGAVEIKDAVTNNRARVDANGNLQIDINAVGVAAMDLAKQEDAVHATGDVGVMSLAVRQDAAAALAAAGDYIPLIVDANGRLHAYSISQPFATILEGGLTELIGIDEQVDQNDYGASVGVALGGTYSGEILHVTLYTSETGTGAILTPAGWLLVFDADPTIAAGDTSISAAERQTLIGQISVLAADWIADANGASATIQCQPLAFHSLATLWFAWFHTDAVSFNDLAGDDEMLDFNFWYRRDS